MSHLNLLKLKLNPNIQGLCYFCWCIGRYDLDPNSLWDLQMRGNYRNFLTFQPKCIFWVLKRAVSWIIIYNSFLTKDILSYSHVVNMHLQNICSWKFAIQYIWNNHIKLKSYAFFIYKLALVLLKKFFLSMYTGLAQFWTLCQEVWILKFWRKTLTKKPQLLAVFWLNEEYPKLLCGLGIGHRRRQGSAVAQW